MLEVSKMNKLIELLEYGQSYWLDNLSRKIINNGDLKKRVSKQGLRGITSNPSIFNESVSNSNEYDEVIKELVFEGKTVQEIYDIITIKDVQDACDILNPVYKQSKGRDGFVSLEVRPALARDTVGTISEARRLFAAVGRKNCMIKIPGTQEGIAAIEQALYEGININITLLFSLKRYNEVSGAYIRALKKRLKEGKDISSIISVASFFLSRIDTLVDQLIGQHIKTNAKDKNSFCPEQLLGKVGTASAVLAYQQLNGLFGSKEWLKMKKHGANVQRLLWASTSNKDPFYSDLRYVEPLIGPNTINTLPEKTIRTFAEHGQLKKHVILSGLSDASQVMELLGKLQINLDAITQQLEDEGIKKFSDSFLKLTSNLAKKRSKILNDFGYSQVIKAGLFQQELNELYGSLNEKQVPQRMFAKTPGLWKAGKEEMKSIKKGLGWLNLPEDMLLRVDQYTNFADTVKREKFESVVLLGMGGSSLCSEVARETFGSAINYPKLYVLDNTDTAVIKHLENKLNLERTLFIVASKSGTTLETDCFFRYFYRVLFQKIGDSAGQNFVAITDKGTHLVKIATKYKFRKVFINLPDIGGRYSVLSDFGILPMALVGIDINAILVSAKRAMISCGPDVPSNANPGIMLGALLGLAQRNKCDKVTFVLSDSIKPFGFWVEQLLAESTGKEGKGLIPVNGESLDAPSTYNTDRIFIHMYLNSDDNKTNKRKLSAIEKAGFPVVEISMENIIELGGTYYYWEIATAIAGLIMGINPFDQPNVAESKNNTNNILNEWIKEGSFSRVTPIIKKNGIEVFVGKKIRHLIKARSKSLDDLLRSIVNLAGQHDYIAILPYFELTEKRNKLLKSFRKKLKSKKKVATTLLNGPRYLHSTGQLHKGGPDSGLYILLIGEQINDINIPGQKYSFETLHQAQALGDFRSLDDKGRRVMRIYLGKEIDLNLAVVCNTMKNMKSESHETSKN